MRKLPSRFLGFLGHRFFGIAKARKRDRFRKYLCETLEPRNLLATFIVNSLLDGPINTADDATVFTLREATHASNLTVDVDTVVFAPSLTANGPATITLTGGMMALSDVTLVGPGAHLLTVDGNNNVNNNANGRIFRIDTAHSAKLSGLTLKNGRDSRGGAIENLGTLAIANAWFESNAATSLDGGAIYNAGSLTVNSSTFSANSATSSAGAIGVYLGGNATIVNSTFSGNSALLFGGAIDVNVSTATIINSTIVSNRAQSNDGGTGNGGGISNFGTVTLHNTIVAGNTMLSTNAANDLANSSVQSTSSSNIVGDAGSSGGLTHGTNGNIVGNAGTGTLPMTSIVNPTLANNGGPTLTHALAGDGPAIDAISLNAFPAEVLADSPLVYYPLNETSGTTIDDATTASRDATINPVGIQLGQPSLPGFQAAPRFVNGTPDSTIAVPDLGTHSAVTIEAWIHPTSRPTPGDFDVIYNSRDYNAGAIHMQLTNTGTLDMSVSSEGFNFDFLQAGNASTFPLNQWTHVAVIYSNAEDRAEVFVNGVSIATKAFTGNRDVTLAPGDIGAWNSNGNLLREFDGFIDEVAIYPSVLSPARIQSHFLAGLSGNDQRGDARRRDVPGLNDPGAKSDIGAVEAGRSIIDLSNLGPAGTTIFGADANDDSGYSVSSAGDVNGDGFDDLLIGARYANASDNTKNRAGDSYVIFGASLPATIDLANLGSAGITIFGDGDGDQSGASVSSAGDVNGDGFDDLIIGARFADASGSFKSNAGESYVIFGAASLPITIDLADLGTLGPIVGITIFGAERNDRSGISVSSAGDVNNDGFDDLLVGASRAAASGNAKVDAGDSYVIFGAASLPATIDLANLGSAGITIFGAGIDDRSGISVSSAGDVNGDGFDDLFIGAYQADATENSKINAGESYVIFGAASLPAMIDLNTLGSAGITIFGADVDDRSGRSVSSAGDVNGDGFDDLIIGATAADALGNTKDRAGDSYVIFGATSLPATIDLANLGAAGITIFGADSDDRSGFSVSSAGDVNGDGFDDLLIGARYANASDNTKNRAGDSYVIFGATSLPATIDLANLGSAGITIFGADADDQNGRSVSSAGDVNGDGFDDFVIGANQADALRNAKTDAGESYVIFGSNSFTNSIAVGNLGTNAANTINGAAGAQILNGADGDDTLVGFGGADVLLGGRGNDIFEVTDLTFRRIVGGNGKDTLKINGAGLLVDLTTNVKNRFVNIERIDITGNGNNELTFTRTDLLALSTSSNTLQIKHDVGDTIRPGTNWKAQGLQKVDGIYVHVITQDRSVTQNQAQLEIDNTLPYQNPLDRYDVDRNGNVNPFDVLVLINDLNRNGVRNLTIPQSANETPSTTFYVDVDGEGDVDPFDVLQVINHLNRSTGGEGESKGSDNSMDSDVGSRSRTQTSHAVPPMSSMSVNDRYFETFDVKDLEQRRRTKVAPR